MPSIHKNLVLDHIYFSITDVEFYEIKNIFSKFDCVSHNIVDSDGESWEGLYLFNRGFNYLEFLRGRKLNSMGICQKPYGILSQDSAHIMSDFPDLPWKSFSRSDGRKPWFTAFSLEDYLDQDTSFNTWVMKYHQRDGGHLSELKKFEIERIIQIEVSASPDKLETIQKNSSWMNAQIKFDANEVSYKFQTYFSDDYELVIRLDEKIEGFRFESISFVLKDPSMAEAAAMSVFKAEILDKIFKVSRIGR